MSERRKSMSPMRERSMRVAEVEAAIGG